MASKPHRAASAVALTELMLLASGCMAPMCRTSEIERGFTLSAELGPTAFRGIGVVHDTTGRVHTGIVDLTCIGAQADLRVAL
ncbi:hypothetical protein FJY71_01415, partial [candidate division WOR-3 bacterium]|nr:hypothetical protein [candidate division WOR-3 bacterium]